MRAYFSIFVFLIFLSGCGDSAPNHSLLGITVKSGTTLPTTVTAGSTVTAYFTVTNNTLTTQNNISIKTLPSNVIQVTSDGTYEGTCAAVTTLNTRATCTLQLTISGPVAATETLTACLNGSLSCVSTHALTVLELMSIAVTPEEASIDIAETQQLTATGTYSDDSTADLTADVTWTSSDTDIATVSESGLATGVAAGSTNVTATLDTLSSDSELLTVNDVSVSLVSIAVTPTSETMARTDTQQLTATGTYSDDSTADITDDVTWTSSDANIVTVSEAGLATGDAIGTSNITATLDSITSNSATLEIKPRFAYIGEFKALAPILVCSVDPDTGGFTDCQDSGGGTFESIEGISFSQDGGHAYIANYGNGSVSLCSVDNIEGMLSGCASTGSGFAGPAGITLNDAGTLAYVTDSAGNSIDFCEVDSSDGSLNDCSTTVAAGLNAPTSIVFNADETLAYIASFFDDAVLICSVDDSTGALSGCVDSGATFDEPYVLLLDSPNNFFYVTNYGDKTVLSCAVNETTGALSDCSNSGGIGDGYPVFDPTSQDLMYISDYTNGIVVLCDVNSTTGTLSNCTDVDGDGTAAFDLPSAVVLQ